MESSNGRPSCLNGRLQLGGVFVRHQTRIRTRFIFCAARQTLQKQLGSAELASVPQTQRLM